MPEDRERRIHADVGGPRFFKRLGEAKTEEEHEAIIFGSPRRGMRAMGYTAAEERAMRRRAGAEDK